MRRLLTHSILDEGPAAVVRTVLRRLFYRAHRLIQPNRYASAVVPSTSLADKEYVRTLKTPSGAIVLIDTTECGYSLKNNLIFDADHRQIGQANAVLNPGHMLLERTRHIDGSVAYLSNTNPSNYYHWLCLTLPMLMYYQSEYDPPPDRFYIGSNPPTTWQLESLERAGVRPDQVVSSGVTADRIVAMIGQGTGVIPDSSWLEFSRGLFEDSEPTPKKHRRLFVGRGSGRRRRFLNEIECADILHEEFGFEFVTLDGRPISEQASMFREAEVVVGAHGSTFTNLLFATPTLHLVEIQPFAYEDPVFVHLARYMKCGFTRLYGEPIRGIGSHERLLVDVEKLRTTIRKLV